MNQTQKMPEDEKNAIRTFLTIRERLNKIFINRTPLLAVGPKSFTTNDVVAAAVLAKTNIYLMGSRGSGKTVLAEALKRSIFGDQGFYLRGDINLQLKDLYVKLNLDGRTEQEIFRISEAISFNFALIDELNRVPGILQNQFLNIADGYIEIRGEKYPLGKSKYLLMVATGNPSSNGEYTGVFDEDLALLDRIALIINMDETELAEGDIYKISEGDINKDGIPSGDETPNILKAYTYLRTMMNSDPEIVAIKSLLTEAVYRAFRFVEIGGKRVDKEKDAGWRDTLLTGSHTGGELISFCSDISTRTLLESSRLAFVMFKMAEKENELLVRKGVSDASIGTGTYVDAYLSAVKLALTYDRRFIPDGLPAQLGKTHQEMLEGAMNDFRSRLDIDAFEKAVIVTVEILKDLASGKIADAEKKLSGIDKMTDERGKIQIMRAAQGVVRSKLGEIMNGQKTAMLLEALDEA